MKIIFMGTPDFSVPTLETLAASPHEVVAVVTQPDKPRGRGGKSLSGSPVKEAAVRLQIPVYQPAKVKDPEFVQLLRQLAPDVIVVAAFGQIISREILELPQYGCINVHASLLPRYRGAAPIAQAILDGEKETGITIMQMDPGIDTGDILLVEKIPIDPEETCGSLFHKLSLLGGQLLLQVLEQAREGRLQPKKQDDSQATYVKMIHKEEGKMDFTRPAVELERLTRGMNPWPSAYAKLDGKTIKIWRARVCDGQEGTPGEVVSVAKDAFAIQTSQGLLEVLELQLEGKKRMETRAFLAGYPLKLGMHLE